ncbi:hypothetical protein E4U21_007466 [Claviceps maximensis]|nr:hypothetical protein E4U21_007466 [Claviceps maximensis]
MAPRNRPRALLLLGFTLRSSSTGSSTGGSNGRSTSASVCAAKDPLLENIRHGPLIASSPSQDDAVSHTLLCAGDLRHPNPDLSPDSDPDPDPDDVSPRNETHVVQNPQPRHPLDKADPGAAPSTISSTDKGNYPPVIPEHIPLVTTPPSQEAALATLGYKQMTYYTCNAIGAHEQCEWHVPIVRAQGVKRDSGTVWIVVVCLAGVFALGLV